MKKIILHILTVLFAVTFQAQTYRYSFSDSLYNCTYELKKGFFDGAYTSYYKNGKIKAQGNFKNNLRNGLWTVWDSTGKKRMQRDYKSVFEYKRVFPPIPNEDAIALVSQDKYVPKRNADGYYDYAYLKEMDVYAAKRVWQTVYKKNNEWLFTNNTLFDTLCKLKLHDNSAWSDYLHDTLIVFDDDDFLRPKIKPSSVEVVGVKIKEDWFFDRLRLISETRIIGICPIVKVGYGGSYTEDIELGWLYYPQIRKILAAQKISIEECPGIKNFEDIFNDRFFSGTIYKESNYWDRQLSDYTKDINKESERIKLSIIEMEHDIWLDFTK